MQTTDLVINMYIYIYCTSLKNAWGILQRSKQITSGCNLPVTSAAALQSSTRVSRKAALLTWNARIRFSELCDYFQVRVKVFYRIQPSAYVVHYVESRRSKNKQPRTRARNRKPYAIGLMKKTVYHSYAKILFNYIYYTNSTLAYYNILWQPKQKIQSHTVRQNVLWFKTCIAQSDAMVIQQIETLSFINCTVKYERISYTVVNKSKIQQMYYY